MFIKWPAPPCPLHPCFFREARTSSPTYPRKFPFSPQAIAVCLTCRPGNPLVHPYLSSPALLFQETRSPPRFSSPSFALRRVYDSGLHFLSPPPTHISIPSLLFSPRENWFHDFTSFLSFFCNFFPLAFPAVLCISLWLPVLGSSGSPRGSHRNSCQKHANRLCRTYRLGAV